ncbi:MAG: hypothetical protein NT027_20450 [Proteobacteria bacterium]|nr:hypothetical protein [Pseudomonadota bacterium]
MSKSEISVSPDIIKSKYLALAQHSRGNFFDWPVSQISVAISFEKFLIITNPASAIMLYRYTVYRVNLLLDYSIVREDSIQQKTISIHSLKLSSLMKSEDVRVHAGYSLRLPMMQASWCKDLGKFASNFESPTQI